MVDPVSGLMSGIELVIKTIFGFELTPLIFAGIIGFFAWRSYRKACARLDPLDASLKRFRDRLAAIKSRPEFAEAREILEDEFSEDPHVGHAWRGYSAELYSDEQTGTAKNSLYPSDFFNERLYNRGSVNLREFESTPNQLVGWGLLATFLGLVAALLIARDGIQSDLEQSKAALRALLSASAVKFLTSVAALLASILYARGKNARLHVTEHLIEDINHQLERLVTFVTAERIAEDSKQQLIQQTSQLERFNQDLAVSIAGALDEKIGQTFSTALKPVTDAIDGMAAKLGEINQDALEKMVDRFSGELSGAAQEHTKRLGEMLETAARSIGEIPGYIDAAGERFREQVTASTDELTTSFTAASENMDATLQRSVAGIAQSLREVAGEIEATGDTVRDQIMSGVRGAADELNAAGAKLHETMAAGVTDLSTSMVAAVDNIDAAIARAGEGLSVSLGGAAERIEKGAQSLATVAERSEGLAAQFEAALSLAREVSEGLQTLVGQVQQAGEAADTLGELADEMAEVAGQLERAADNVGKVADRVGAMNERSTEVVEGLTSRVDGINRDLNTLNNALANTMQKVFDGLGQYSERTTAFVKSVDKDLAEAVGRLSGAVQQLDEVLDEMPKRGDFKSFSDSVTQFAAARTVETAE